MSATFHSFILLAEMRTGSNFLEENLNAIPGLRCWGEAFNPHFTGHAGKTEMAGVTLAAREADPMALLAAMRARTEGLAGFRFFNDHDPRVLETCLADRACAKVILTRNPLDSYVSHAIARQTGQWRLGDMKQAKSARAMFVAADFSAHLNRLQGFQRRVMRALQTSGQTAFYIAYDDIQDLDVLAGLARFLGLPAGPDRLSDKTKVQNPGSLRDKVVNYDQMVAALADIDHFDLNRTPNFEPRRGAGVPGILTAARAALLFHPVPCGPTAAVVDWLTALDGEPPGTGGMTQKDLRRWKRQHPGHRSFTVVRHPVDRAHAAFCTHILRPGPDCFADIRETLRSHYGVPMPDGAPGAGWTPVQHRAAFLAFLTFVKGNLGGQTGIRVDGAWASQSVVVQGMAQVAMPDMILRDTALAQGFSQLAVQVGLEAPPPAGTIDPDSPLLDAIHDDAIESAVRDAYQRDYMMFGFAPRSG